MVGDVVAVLQGVDRRRVLGSINGGEAPPIAPLRRA